MIRTTATANPAPKAAAPAAKDKEPEFIGRQQAAKRAGISPQLLDYWAKIYPDTIMRCFAVDGAPIFSSAGVDKIVAAKAATKAMRKAVQK